MPDAGPHAPRVCGGAQFWAEQFTDPYDPDPVHCHIQLVPEDVAEDALPLAHKSASLEGAELYSWPFAAPHKAAVPVAADASEVDRKKHVTAVKAIRAIYLYVFMFIS